MPVRIRLKREGRKHKPFYNIVVADSRSPRDGKFLEKVGTYNPIANSNNEKEVYLNIKSIKKWISVGAQPSKIVFKLLNRMSVLPNVK